MLNKKVIALALASAFVAPLASAADSKELREIREQIRQMKEGYEARLAALEARLAAAQNSVAAAQTTAAAAENKAQAAVAATEQAAVAAPAAAAPPAAPANIFNPNMSLTLGGTAARLSQDPAQYRLQGFIPAGGETGPGQRSFNLGESELTLSANVDPHFSGQLTFSLSPENEASVEEAFIQTRALDHGLNLKFGRFLSSIGYLNGNHAHTWDFVDAPLAYQAFLGGQYKPDGVQAKWLAPLDQFLEIGAEIGNGSAFPGTDRNKNGSNATAIYAHLGDDVGASSSYRIGASWLRTRAEQRGFEDQGIANAFSGKSSIWIADAIWKWAPNGNATSTNFKLQGEYFRRKEDGVLDHNLAADSGPTSSAYASKQSGWYMQGVYQFMPNWRLGLRQERLSSGTPTLDAPLSLFPILERFAPTRSSVMVDYSPSEFSRLRLQFARDQSRPGATDNQLYLQYIMSLGTHAAHSF
jgi:hypothetical protein